jgi:2-dehydropantoate 2-reductase
MPWASSNHSRRDKGVNVLLVGAGVIGSVFGVQLVKAGHGVEACPHGARTTAIARDGLRIHDTVADTYEHIGVPVAVDWLDRDYDLVLVCVWANQIPAVLDDLRSLAGSPVVLVCGNKPLGRRMGGGGPRARVHLGFPGVGGSLQGDVVDYMRIPQQPTTLEAGGGVPIAEFEQALTTGGFPVRRTDQMDGWLAYHAVFIGSITAALDRSGGDAAVLAANRPLIRLMCRSIEEGFRALGRRGVGGAPRNLRRLHRRGLRPFATWYWARTMRSPMGEQCFAAHARHAQPEMRLLAHDALEQTAGDQHIAHLRQLLAAP